MAQADSVHSTPPTNTPIDKTRRRFLIVSAFASAAGAGSLTAAAMMPNDDANSFPKCDGRLELVDLWRTALMKQMLTPAPDVAAVAWKRAQMRAENYRYTDVKPERLQRAIDADVEWLEAHPSRKSIAASRQAKKD